MNSHDPLCGWGNDAYPECFPAEDCGNCEMIQRIRFEVSNNKYHDETPVWEAAYAQGYEDAMKECNMTFEDFRARKQEWEELISLITKGKSNG